MKKLAIVAGILLAGLAGESKLQAQAPSNSSGPTNVYLESWSFVDTVNWTDDDGYPPISFTNLAYSSLGDFHSVVIDTNVPAWLQCHILYPDWTNLTVDVGSLTFWFAPSSWSGTNGTGEYARLFEVGSYTHDSSYGWWSVFVDPTGRTLCFAAQTNDLSTNLTTYISYPISWTNNFFHFLAFTYCPTNTALYLDGILATNGPGMTVYPGSNVLANGFFLGSSSNGLHQAHGLFDTVQTFGYPLNANDIQALYNWYYPNFEINPNNAGFMFNATSFNPAAYGTNLALTPPSFLSSTGSLFVVNSAADILYELQSKTNLMQTNWITEGYVYGSELTNWTQLNLVGNGRPRLFLRLRSWQSSDGSGLPDWWELQYFGTTGIDPNALDSAGDGWTIYQKFQMGLNPTNFYTPPAPQGVVVGYNANNGTAKISWLPSPGTVTGYTVEQSYTYAFSSPQINDFSTSGTTYTADVSSDQPDPWNNGNIMTTFRVRATYAGGYSAWSAAVPLEAPTFAASLNAGTQGTPLLTVAAMPANTTAVRLMELDEAAINQEDYAHVFVTNFNISTGSFTNNVGALPNVQTTNGPECYWVAQAVGADGSLSANTFLGMAFSGETYNDEQNNWLAAPFYDGRVELKQNLIFQLRSALMDRPFRYAEFVAEYPGMRIFYSAPTNYAYAGFYNFVDYNAGDNSSYYTILTPQQPFGENAFDRNFVFDSSVMDANGLLTTGIGDYDHYDPLYDFPNYDLAVTNSWYNWQQPWLAYLTYQLQPPITSSTPAMLAANQTRWLASYPQDSYPDFQAEVGISWSYDDNYNAYFTMANGARNCFGLPYLSATLTYQDENGNLATSLLSAGTTLYNNGFWNPVNLYPETAQPVFQAVEYDFWTPNWTSPAGPYNAAVPPDPLPGGSAFSPTNASRLLLTPVGNPNFQIAGYAKLAVANGYPGVYGYLGQYFDQAYTEDAYGNATTNTTGVLSPYGSFFATEPGPAALMTMPDVDTGARGTDTVYCVSVVIDRSQASNMDLSFNGANATSANNPATVWANNNFDRWKYDSDDNTNYMDDVQIGFSPAAPSTLTPDCNYSNKLANGYAYRAIPCTRDLQDFFRLWVCGIDTNLIAKLPSGSTVTLNWGDVGSPNSANPTIDLFTAADPDGGIGYLTNGTVAAQQTNAILCPYIGRLAPGGSIQLNASQFNGWAGSHFIMCGVSNGTGGLNLTIADGSGNVLAQSTSYLQIMDIKQMYERWTVGDLPNTAPANTASLASDDGLPAGVPAFQYPAPQNTNTSYILLVHGWNLAPWEKDRFAESAFKRLYWQGYKGRFGSFRWPTTYLNPTGNSVADDAILASIYDPGEYNAWRSSDGLLNKLKDLNTQYPGHVYVLAHSMGNVVTGEALRKAAQQGLGQIVNTYVASQAAVPAHCYDSTLSGGDLLGFFGGTLGPSTANIYNNWLATNSAAVGTRINFYNTNDYALSAGVWQLDEEVKPDSVIGLNPPYGYNGTPSDNPPLQNGFYSTAVIYPFQHILYLGNAGTLQDRYEITSFAAEPRSLALGATPDIKTVTLNVNLGRASNPRIWPTDSSNYAKHFWHSAEFEGDYPQQQGYWIELLGAEAFGLK